MDPGDPASSAGPGGDLDNRLDDLRFGGFQSWFKTERQAKVGRADIDPVNAVHAKDRIKVGQGLAGFDHRKQKNLFVCLASVTGTVDQVCARGAERACAKRRVTRGLDQTLRVFPCVDHRADQAGEARVEAFHDDPRLVPRHTAQDRRGQALKHLTHGQGHLVVDKPVLKVHRDHVEPGPTHNLGRDG